MSDALATLAVLGGVGPLALGAPPPPALAPPLPGTAVVAAFGLALRRALEPLAPAVSADDTLVQGAAQAPAEEPPPAAPAAIVGRPVLALELTAAPARADAPAPLPQAAPAAPLPAGPPGRARVPAEALRTERSLTALDPEFRERLARVIGRVERELGLEVRVLETHRTPERQQALYAQGRTAPGPVVTWTRASRHSEGLAADVQLVGAAPESGAYRQLGQIAAEEGLRTLGARDPGHIELPRVRGEAPAGPGTVPPALPARPAPDPVERVLAIARAAGRAVPRAEDVRQLVAERYRTSLAEPRALHAMPAAAVAVPAAQPAAVPAAMPATPARSVAPEVPVRAVVPGPEPARDEREMPFESVPAPEVPPAQAERGSAPVAAPPAPPAQPAVDARPDPQPLDARVVQRVERVLALQDTFAAQPVHSVLLRLDEGASPLAHIRVGLRGSVVDAAMDVADPALARVLREELPELQRALQTKGLHAGPFESLRAAGVGAEALLAAPVARSMEPGWKQDTDGSTSRQFPGHSRDPQHRQRNPRQKEEQP